MVLGPACGGAAECGVPTFPLRARRQGEAGSQTLEFALVTPSVVLLLVLVLHAGLLATDLIAAQGLAREAARVATVADESTTRAALVEAAGGQPVGLTLTPVGQRLPGELVTAEVRLRSRAFRAFGAEIWLPARATMRVEDR